MQPSEDWNCFALLSTSHVLLTGQESRWAFIGWLPRHHLFIPSSAAKCAYQVVKGMEVGLEVLLDQGPSPVPPSPCSKRRSPEDRGDVSQRPHLGRCGRTLSSCQSTARSASGLSGSSPQRQGSRLRTCRFHSKYPDLKGKIIGGSAGETRSVFPR